MTTDSNDNGNAPALDKSARLADLLARSNAEGTPANIVTVQGPRSNVRYESAGDMFVNLDTGARIPAAEVEAAAANEPADETALIPDDGRSLQFSINQIHEKFEVVRAKYEAHTFDGLTGEKKFIFTPAERERLAAELVQLRESGEWEVAQANKIMAQRERLKAAQHAAIVAADERAERIAKNADSIFELKEAERLADRRLAEKYRK